MAKFLGKFKLDNDTGFGALATNQAQRLINKDGTYNVTRTGVPFFNRINSYHDLISISWTKFIILVICTYLASNLIFTLIYWQIGVEHLGGLIATNPWEEFMETFFFSCQTYSTVGYGRINPQGNLMSAVAALESLIGLMSFAIVTGLIYGRFSKPSIKLLKSENAIIAPYQNGKALMFRIVNARKNALLDLEVSLMVTFLNPETRMMQFLPLKLERATIASLALSWTIVHPINEESPLFNLTEKEFEEYDLQLMLSIHAFDEGYSQTVHTRVGYLYNDILWGKKFVPMYERSLDGSTTLLHLEKLNEMIDAAI